MFGKRLISLSIRYKSNVLGRLYGSQMKESAPASEDVVVKERLFTGLKPTENIHLGAYLGVVKNFVEMQDSKDDALLCITDMNSIIVAQDPPILRKKIFRMAALLLACGVDPSHTTLFVQSAVKEHCELCWILGLMSSMAELGSQPAYVEKLRQYHEVELGLFTYPVMQAADILLYKSTHVAVGEDQIPQVHFAQSLAKSFNSFYGMTFPNFKPIVAKNNASRLTCLTDPSKKMSKFYGDQSVLIYINDEPNDIVAKIKAATIDFGSDVRYDPDKRVGISNLISIHASVVGKSPIEIVSEASSLDTEQYKSLVAEVLIEHLAPIRKKFNDLLARRDELTFNLDAAATKAHFIAAETIMELKQKMGLGTSMAALHHEEIAEKNKRKRRVSSFLNKAG